MSNEIQNVETKNKLQNFSQLLRNIKSLDEKKQMLWLEIYENAITDRQCAYTNYAQLMRICEDKSSEHAIHGRTLATYLERMSKSNDQLVKLAELIAKAQEKDENTMSNNDIFKEISQQGE